MSGIGDELTTYSFIDLSALPPQEDTEMNYSEGFNDIDTSMFKIPDEFANPPQLESPKMMSYSVENSDNLLDPSQSSSSSAPQCHYTENEFITVRSNHELENIKFIEDGQIILIEYSHESNFINRQCVRLNGCILPDSNFICKAPIQIEIKEAKFLPQVKNVGINHFLHITDGSVKSIKEHCSRLGISNIGHRWYGKVRKVRNGICKDDRGKLRAHIQYLGNKYTLDEVTNLCYKTVLESFGRPELFKPFKTCPSCGILGNNRHTAVNCRQGKHVDRDQCGVKLFAGGQVFPCQRARDTNHTSVHRDMNYHVTFYTVLPDIDQFVPKSLKWSQIKEKASVDSITDVFWLTIPLTESNIKYVMSDMMGRALDGNEMSLSKVCKCHSKCLPKCRSVCGCAVKCNCLYFLANNYYCMVHSSHPHPDKLSSVKIGVGHGVKFLQKHLSKSNVAKKKHILLYIYCDNVEKICYKEGIKLINSLNLQLIPDGIKFTIIISSKFESTINITDNPDITLKKL